MEVHVKSDLVPAPVHKEKIDCIPKSDHEIWQKSDLSSRSCSWHIIICFKIKVEVTKFDISLNISGILTTFGCIYCFINRGNTTPSEMPSTNANFLVKMVAFLLVDGGQHELEHELIILSKSSSSWSILKCD